MTDTDATDNRSAERINIIDFQQIHDSDTGKVVGYLGDISYEGLRVLRHDSLPVGERFDLRVKYVLLGGEAESIDLRVESIWERAEEAMPYREIGFRILDPSEDVRSSIDRIVADLKQRAEDT